MRSAMAERIRFGDMSASEPIRRLDLFGPVDILRGEASETHAPKTPPPRAPQDLALAQVFMPIT